ncbi:hypothetical protein AX769_03965 [Frondihabitans sp. PAMC 28766]|uniref:hypothetical protein n=1 Tax=Frondihabitans sp. PAMC 28766 TaxID=1795630 RepID=UPI00078EA3B3|nr:hypothetical protein [Frondihabitans sp. PAMC 28766]AMM19453.1 hypothetical protein AX769_03965 [Frondihabitans sp. PAMC 28766]
MFYSRDLAHQALGAHLLGLDDENFAMFRHFARSATERRRLYPLWAFNFDGSPAAVDYHSDDDFVRETPAVFELVEKSLEQFLWTRDARWLDDPDLARFARATVTRFADLHDVQGTGIAGEKGGRDIFAGSPTYNEASGTPDIQVAADALASQWAAMRLFALVAANGEEQLELLDEVERIKSLFEHEWWHDDHYITGRTATGPIVHFANEPSWFPAVKGLLDFDSERATNHLAFLSRNLQVSPPGNIEAFTYLPEAFHRYGQDDEALAWIIHLLESRALYPEVSFTLIAHLATGLTGLQPNLDGSVATRSHIDDDSWVQVEHVSIAGADISVRHDGRRATTITVHSASGPLVWNAGFDGGEHRSILVEPGTSAELHANHP